MDHVPRSREYDGKIFFDLYPFVGLFVKLTRPENRLSRQFLDIVCTACASRSVAQTFAPSRRTHRGNTSVSGRRFLFQFPIDRLGTAVFFFSIMICLFFVFTRDLARFPKLYFYGLIAATKSSTEGRRVNPQAFFFRIPSFVFRPNFYECRITRKIDT